MTNVIMLGAINILIGAGICMGMAKLVPYAMKKRPASGSRVICLSLYPVKLATCKAFLDLTRCWYSLST